MSNSLENPFQQGPDAKPDFGALANLGFLSPSEQENLTDKANSNPKSRPNIRSLMDDLSLEDGFTAEERAETKRIELIRNEIINWAKKWNLGDDEWVVKTFDFQSDGSVICKGNLDLGMMTKPDFPKQIIEVQGHLDLYSLTSAEHLNLPTTMNGWLDLHSLTSAEHLELTDIKGDVYLDNLNKQEKDKLRTKYPNLSIK